MILRNITINNFRSYYGKIDFEISEGLTLIIGDNGDGKTTFFEALEWLFDLTNESDKYASLSEMRSSQMKDKETETLYVELTFDHEGTKVLRKSRQFKKNGKELEPVKGSIELRGYQVVGSERYPIDGEQLLKACFDTYIQNYSLFKGESALEILNNEEALKKLVDTFSDLNSFNDYVALTEEFLKKSNRAFTKEATSGAKKTQEVQQLNNDIADANQKIAKITAEIESAQKAYKVYDEKVNESDISDETREEFQIISDRLKNKKDEFRKKSISVKDDLNRRLLDSKWILCLFPNVFKEFSKKIHDANFRKREEHDSYIAQKNREEGKLESLEEIGMQLENGEPALPWYLPKEEILQEMIDAHICKVCGRPFQEGDKAHQYLQKKLDNYRQHVMQKRQQQAQKVAAIKPIFKYEYTEQIDALANTMSGTDERRIAGLVYDIKDRLAEIKSLQLQLQKLEVEIQDIEEDKARLMMQNKGLSEEQLRTRISDYKSFLKKRQDIESDIKEKKNKLAELQDYLNSKNEELKKQSPENYRVKLYQEVSNVFERIHMAFQRAKDENLRVFLNDLQTKANDYFDKLNAEDFHGTIRIERTLKDVAEIKLYSSNGTEIKDPGGAQETTMHMSVLFAISDLTTRKKEEDYPLIFDAPTSSFGEFKEDVFYNIIDTLDKQCIIVTKDLLDIDPVTRKKILNERKINELRCSIYRIQKKEPFDPNDLSTICTIKEHIK